MVPTSQLLNQIGPYEIHCPNKGGVLAIERCREFQGESAHDAAMGRRASGCAARCEAIAAYHGGTPTRTDPVAEGLAEAEQGAAKPKRRKKATTDGTDA